MAALREGTPVGLVGDRDLTGGGTLVPLFGAPATLPLGPAMLAVESGATPYVVAVRRAAHGRYIGHAGAGRRPGRWVAARAGHRHDDEPGRRLRTRHRGRAGPVVGRVLPDLAGPRGGRGVSPRRTSAAAPSRRSRPAARPARLGRADLHIHTVASDGTAGVATILDHVVARGDLDVIAITDHERIDAAVAARTIAADRGLPVEVVVGEEVTTRGGHLLALFVETRIPPYRSLRDTIAAVHDAGGLAIPAHPLVPYPLCAQGWVLRGLIEDADERVHPDAIETFNPTALGRPWHATGRALRRPVRPRPRRQQRRPRARRDRDRLDQLPGPDGGRPARRDRAGAPRSTTGAFHGTAASWACSGDSCPSAGRDARDELVGRWRRDGTGRDHGYPGGRHDRPLRPRAAGRPRTRRRPRRHEDRPRLPVHLPGGRRRRPARPVPLREPAPERPRRPDRHREPRARSARRRATSCASASGSRCRRTARSGR